MKKFMTVVALLLAAGFVQAGNDGLITKKSAHSVKVTLDRLVAALEKNGIGVALRWNHSEKGKEVDIPLRPTELLLFGNPKLGTHLFTSNQTAGIDLPLKALAWEDAKGQVWLTYNDPAYIAKRHRIGDRDDIVAKMSKALAGLSDAATKP